MTADNDIVERLQSAGHLYATPHDAIMYEAAAEIVRLRGEAESMEQMARMQAARADAAEREVTHLRSIASAEAKGPAPAMPNWVDGLAYAQRLAVAIWSRNYREVSPQWEVCEDLMGVLSQIDNMVSGMSAADNRDAAGVDSEEDAYVIERMGKMLAEIAIIVNGPEPAGTKWSYHDLPAKVRALAAQPAAGDGPRPCTCHPDDSPPVPCARMYALHECREAAAKRPGAGDVDGTHTATPCHWIEDTDSGAWDTACGQKHLFTAGDATDNGHSFCPYCGGRLFSQLTSVEPQP